MKTLALLAICLHLTNAVIHSWKAFYTGTTGLSEFPEFVALNLIDDQLMGYFDSKTNRFKSQFKWMADNLGEEYEDRQTNILQGHIPAFSNNIRIVMERFNQTQGIHTVQQMYGCSWDDETGDVDGFDEHGYDGEDFLSLDLKNLQYVTTLPQGVITQVKWNNNQAKLEQEKQYANQICIEWLKKYLQYGKSAFKSEVSPQVSLLQKDSSSPVTCHATGFYPEQVAISWLKNDQEHHEDVELGELVPNEDGTYQKASTLKVKPEEWKNNQFKCVVEHKGKAIRTIVTEKEIRTNIGNVPIALIVGVIVAVILLVVAGIVGFKIYQKKKGFKPVNTSDGGSNSSSSQTGP